MNRFKDQQTAERPASVFEQRIDECNNQLSAAVHELHNAVRKVQDISGFTKTELAGVDPNILADNPVFARANELLFESHLLLDAFSEE